MATRKMNRTRKKMRIRKRVRGSAERPRLAVYRSAKHIYAQIIDDDAGKTLTCVSSLSKEISAPEENGGKSGTATRVGKLIAERCKTLGVTSVVFDRGGYIYHGRVAKLAAGAREGGLNF